MKFIFSAAVIAGAVALTKNAVLAQGVINTDDSTVTSADNLISALLNTNQTEGVPADAYPAEPVDATVVATNTSEVVDAPTRRWFEPVAIRGINKGNVATRDVISARSRTWNTILDGTDPANAAYASAAVQMPAYLTYKLVSNTTAYGVSKQACLDFCEKTPKCASANLYYEFENPLLDWTFSEKSNLKCALYGDIPTLNQFTNKGGQQQKPQGYGKTYITQSSAFSNPYPLDNAATPSGYEATYGPINAANNDPTYMTYKFLSQYDPAACGTICNQTPGCASFNIWRGVVNGDPRTYTCSLYRGVVDQSTAVNTGDAVNKVAVTYSRGYKNTAAANALAQCQASGASKGVAWTYIPRSVDDAGSLVCAAPGGEDISRLPALSTSSANDVTTNAISTANANDDAFNPYGGSKTVDGKYFSMLHKFYFKAPKTGKYTFKITKGDDVTRAWFGDKAKSGWSASNSDLYAGCHNDDGVTYQKTMDAGQYLPVRISWLQGNGPAAFSFDVIDPSGNVVGPSAYFQYACDKTVSAFDF